ALTLGWFPATALGLAGGSTGSGGGGGGGSSSSSGGSGDGELTGILWLDLLIVAAMFVAFGGGSALVSWWALRKRRARTSEAERQALLADVGDGYWHPHHLRARVTEAFFPVQMSWERRDIQASRPFVSDSLYERHRLQLEGLEAQHRVNRIEDLALGDVSLVRIHNVTDDGEDRFVARIECSARDWMEDTRTGEMVNGNRESVTKFVQFWSFARHPEHGWVLDEIQQGTEGDYHLEAALVNADGGALDGSPDVADAPAR
ncbi:MAG: TIM44-like domain-containing protein, partial [Miltoncostaeaceae bacterium]